MSRFSRFKMTPALLAILALSAGASTLAPAQAFAAESAKDFVKDAAVSNQFEIQTSQLALQKSTNEKIKKFAQQMIDDHTKAGGELESAVSSAPDADVGMPDKALDSKHQKKLSELGDKSGADFDKLYVKDQVKAHDSAVSLFKSYAANGDNEALRTFASHTLPTLQEHQQYVEKLKSSM